MSPFERLRGVLDGRDTADGGLQARCPAHDDRTASLSVHDRGNTVVLHCFAGCAPVDVLAAVGLGFSDLYDDDAAPVPAVRTTASSADVLDLRFYVERAAAALGEAPDALELVRSRWGIEADQARRLRLGYDDGTMEGRPAFLGQAFESARVVVPFYGLTGELTGCQGRLIGQGNLRWAGPSGSGWGRLACFGVHRDPLAPVVICEGPGDALAAAGAGYASIGIRGASLGGRVLSELTAALLGRQVYVCGDNDAAGRKFAGELAAGLAAAGLAVLRLCVPEGHNDLSDWCAALPHSEFQAALDAALNASELVELESDEGEFSDLGNARRLAAAAGDRIRYVRSWGWLAWDGKRWARDAEHLVRQHAHGVTDALTAEAIILEEEGRELAERGNAVKDEAMAARGAAMEKRGRALRKHGAASGSSARISGMLTEAAVLEGIVARPEDFDTQDHLLTCANGTVDLRTGELGEHDRAHMSTRMTDVAYDPEAAAPVWDEFLARVLPAGDGEVLAFLQRYAGYSATGSTAEHVIVIAHGTGANGKSTFVEALRDALGEYAGAAAFDTFLERQAGRSTTDIAALVGRRLVTASEGESGSRLGEAMVKQLTGGDAVTARFLYRDAFTFRPTFSIILATNHRPRIRGGDEGIWRRVALVPFTVTIPPAERDTGLTDKLRQERAGVLAWIVRGAVAWYEHGLQVPLAVGAATAGYRLEEDVLAGYYPGVWVSGDDGFVSRKELTADFEAWCEQSGVEPMRTSRAFYAALVERGAESTIRGGVRGFRLVRAPLGAGQTCTYANFGHMNIEEPNNFTLGKFPQVQVEPAPSGSADPFEEEF